MSVRHFGFVFLIWFPGVLHAQSAELSCSAPKLDGGYFVPFKDDYAHNTHLSYSCDNGRKPAAEGWWATSTCQNSTWSPTPQCIDENACIPPNIQNAKFTETQNGWYNNDEVIRITCDKGYEPKNQAITARCINGAWSSLPICEKSKHTCGAPPQILHAVIINEGYQNIFAVDSQVKYECEHGYTTERGDTTNSIICLSGKWSVTSPCSRTQGTEYGGSAVEGTIIEETEGTTHAGHGAQPTDGVGGTGSQETGDTVSAGHGTRPAGGGSSTTSGSGSGPMLIPIIGCGRPPNVPNGDVVQKERMFLKYQCNAFYTLVGQDTVTCYSGGTWSQLPICQDAFCKLDPAQYPQYQWKYGIGVQYVKEGEIKYIPCYWNDYSMPVTCNNRRITLAQQCCRSYDIQRGVCS